MAVIRRAATRQTMAINPIPYGTIKDYTGLKGTIWDFKGLYRTKQDCIGLYRSIQDYT